MWMLDERERKEKKLYLLILLLPVVVDKQTLSKKQGHNHIKQRYYYEDNNQTKMQTFINIKSNIDTKSKQKTQRIVKVYNFYYITYYKVIL